MENFNDNEKRFIAIYKNEINGKYLKILQIYDTLLGYSQTHFLETDNLNDAYKFYTANGYTGYSTQKASYKRISYETEEKIWIKKYRKEKLKKLNNIYI